MISHGNNSTREAAIDWAIRLADPGFDDWDGFATWLEADPAHAPAYDQVVAAGELADSALRDKPEPVAHPLATVSPTRRAAWRRPAMGLIAATIVGTVSWGVVSHRAAPYAIETGPGEHRTITTATAMIALNGDTRILLDRHDPHVATLDRGEALFDVRHNAEHPFAVHVGGAQVQDVGTRFDVTREATATRVAVAEGMVVYNPRLEAVRLGAGETLMVEDGAPDLRVAHAAVTEIGGWREDRLSYRQTPLSVVAADLSRGLGIAVVAAPDVARQPFTGVIAYGGDRARFFAGLGSLLDVTVKPDHQRWLLTRKADARL